jgi:hypothetical protein
MPAHKSPIPYEERKKQYTKRYRNSAKGKANDLKHQHSDVKKASDKRYYETQKSRLMKSRLMRRRSNRKGNRKVKEIVFRHYGIACARCGFSDQRALSIDHIEGGGNQHRKAENTGSGSGFYRWLIKNGFPNGFQTLCMNCQFIKNHEQQDILRLKRKAEKEALGKQLTFFD